MDLYIFLSPHFDDAALSCGGLIKRLTTARKRVVVATIFTADLPPGETPSRLARRNHLAWNAGPLPFAARAVEDERAMKVLGAEHKHLGFLDAMYRRDGGGTPFYQTSTVGVPVVDADEREIVPSLRNKFEELRPQYAGFDLHIFSPLSLGGHVDHVLVRKAAEALWNPIYYEDYPYAGREGVTKAWLESEGKDSRWKYVSLKLNPDEKASRVSAVLKYTSQIRGLFPSLSERIYEIVRARVGPLSNAHLPENRNATDWRAETAIRKYIEKVAGEKYWFVGERNDLPDAILRG